MAGMKIPAFAIVHIEVKKNCLAVSGQVWTVYQVWIFRSLRNKTKCNSFYFILFSTVDLDFYSTTSTGDFLCKDRRKCIERNLVCDGRSHCSDGSDEVGCPTVATKTSKTTPLKCRFGSKACRDGSECVLLSHVCDGEKDCRDGSDEEDCEQCQEGEYYTTFHL